MTALLVALGLLVPLVVALMWALAALYRETQRSRLSVGDAVRDALSAQSGTHAKEVEALHEFYRASLTAIGNTVQYGTPTPTPAGVDLEPSAEQSLSRAIEEDTVARGVETLRREYEAAGIAVTDEELRNDVISIVTGQPLQEPASVRGLIRST